MVFSLLYLSIIARGRGQGMRPILGSGHSAQEVARGHPSGGHPIGNMPPPAMQHPSMPVQPAQPHLGAGLRQPYAYQMQGPPPHMNAPAGPGPRHTFTAKSLEAPVFVPRGFQQAPVSY